MLEFDSGPHMYRWNGTHVDSVTQIIAKACGDPFARVPRDVLERKKQIGVAAHFACELDDAGVLDDASVHPEVQPYLDAWRAFRAETGCEVLVSECQLYHVVHGFAGTPDRLVKLNGALAVVDLKSGLPGVLAGMQTAAYLELFDNNGHTRPTQRFALQMLKSGRYKLAPFADPTDWPDFLACLRIARLKQRIA